jgi:hypothetical protein
MKLEENYKYHLPQLSVSLQCDGFFNLLFYTCNLAPSQTVQAFVLHGIAAAQEMDRLL